MLVAAVIDEQKNIVPIIHGAEIRIYDTETTEYKDYPNPAKKLKEGRRGAALRFAQDKGVTAFVAPPETFCELSYKKALDDRIEFYYIHSKLPFKQFEQQLKNGEIQVQKYLLESEIIPSI